MTGRCPLLNNNDGKRTVPMGRNVVSAKLDIIFKKLFSENKDLLQDFLAKILDIPYESIDNITIINPELPPETLSGKFSRLDLTMEFDGKLVNIEIQVKNEPDFRDRTLFYWAKLYTSDLKRGEEYGELKQAITINIVNFSMFEDERYHREIVPRDKETGELFSDKFSIHFFELKKIGKKVNPNDGKELWMQFINAESEEDFEMINSTNDPVMQKAINVIYDMSEDTKTREIARLREKALHDEASALGNARREGRAEGRAEIISKMKAAGMTDEQIREILD